MLANQLAKAVANFRAAVFPLPLDGCGWSFFDSREDCGGSANGPDFLYRADADAVRFAKRAIDRPGFRHAHFGAVDEERDVGRIGITVSDKTSTGFALVDCGLECPTLGRRITKSGGGPNMNAGASTAARQP